MYAKFIRLAAAAAVALAGTASAALEPVTVKGNAFFVGDNRVSSVPVSSGGLPWLTWHAMTVLHPWRRLPAWRPEQVDGPDCGYGELQA